MDVINSVQIFMLLWSFTAVCQGDTDGCSVRCDDVTGTVRNEVIFTCSFSEQCTEGCVEFYKFQYPENNDSAICREEPPVGVWEKNKIFTCRYTPDTAMKETFRFFVQACSCAEETDFTVEISDYQLRIRGNAGHEKTTVAAITAGVGCFIIMLTIIIIYKNRLLDVRKGCFRSSDRTMTTKKEKMIMKEMFYLQGAPERAALSEL